MNPAIRNNVRQQWIDSLRGLGMFCVVLGHTVGPPEWLLKLLFSFHIPIFFWISGYVSRDESKTPPAEYIVDRLQRRMIPYFVFAVGSYLAWLLVLRHFGSRQAVDPGPWIPLAGIFYASPWRGFLEPNIVLWFFPCLFCTEVIHYYLSRWLSVSRQLLWVLPLALLGYAATYQWVFRFPWCLDIALTAGVFFSLGNFCKMRFPLASDSVRRSKVLLLIALSLPVWLAACMANSPVAMLIGNYGNFLFFYLSALGGIAFWACACLFSENTAPARWLALVGKHSMVIFALHLPLFPVFTAFLRYAAGFPPEFREGSPVWGVIYTLAAILVLIAVSRVMERRAPWLLGYGGFKWLIK